jgi:glycosyltransferase involved in cell wall biosynthesis
MPLPLVTAVMAARDAESFVAEAVASVLGQTLAELELIVVDDGSRDATADIVEGFDDPRVRLLRTPGIGRGAARNLALGEARAELIAITDADDISLRERFEIQAGEMWSRPQLAVLGAQVMEFGPWGGPSPGYLTPVGVHAVSARLAEGQTPVQHQACMLRRSAVTRVGGYAADCVRCQDLELMLRLADEDMDNLPDVLVHYRTATRHPSWSYWLENARYRRYAVARATSVRSGRSPLSFTEFSRTNFWCSSLGTGVERLRFSGDRARRRLKPAGVSL